MHYVAARVVVCFSEGAVCTVNLDVLASALSKRRCTQVATKLRRVFVFVFSYLCFCDKVRNFSRSENSTIEFCTQKSGKRPLIGAKPDTMHNSEVCTNQSTLHLDCCLISAIFVI